jgi:hypothetical protein
MMSPLRRKPVNKYKSAGKFKKHVKHTKVANMKLNPMRGGWRL